MYQPITIDLAFLVMLGAALWTVAHLCLTLKGRRQPVRLLLSTVLSEGLLVAIVWATTIAIRAHVLSIDLLGQSLAIGAIWAGFTFVSRMWFRASALAR